MDYRTLKEGQKIAIESNQGFYLLECKTDTEQHRIKDIFNSELFDSIQILKGIPTEKSPSKKIDIYIRSLLNISDIEISYQRYDFQDSIKAFSFNAREKKSIDFQKKALFYKLQGMEEIDFLKIPIASIRKISKLL